MYKSYLLCGVGMMLPIVIFLISKAILGNNKNYKGEL